MKLYIFILLLLYVGNLQAQDKTIWLPGKITIESVSKDISSNNNTNKKSTLKTIELYKYDNFGRVEYQEKSHNNYIKNIETYEYDRPNTTIPTKEYFYSWSYNDDSKKLEFTTEREFKYNENGVLSEIYEYRIEPNGTKNLYAYKSFVYDINGQLEKYINVLSIQSYNDSDSDEPLYDYNATIYKDFVWGQGNKPMPETGTDEWEEWLTSPQSGIKSYTYIYRNATSFEPIGTKDYVYKRTMNYGVDVYPWEECTSLLGNQLEVNTVTYTDTQGSHTDSQIIYNGCKDSEDRNEEKFTQEIVKKIVYTSPNEFTYEEQKRNKDGHIQVLKSTNNRNIFNDHFGYLEETLTSGYERTPGDEEISFEQHTTYSDYNQYTTAIQSIDSDKHCNQSSSKDTIYNIQGQSIGCDASLLKSGIYITHNGKKFFVRR